MLYSTFIIFKASWRNFLMIINYFFKMYNFELCMVLAIISYLLLYANLIWVSLLFFSIFFFFFCFILLHVLSWKWRREWTWTQGWDFHFIIKLFYFFHNSESHSLKFYFLWTNWLMIVLKIGWLLTVLVNAAAICQYIINLINMINEVVNFLFKNRFINYHCYIKTLI